MKLLALLLTFFALLLGSAPIQAQLPGMEIHVHAALETETLRPAAGSTVTLAITMQPDAGWHGYWINPGDAGEGLTLDWDLPEGARIGAPRFPVPDTLIISGFMNYVYERPHAVLVDLTLPPDLNLGDTVPISVVANWLACTDRVCVPQQGTLALELVVGDGKAATAARARFDTWRAALPVPLDRDGIYAVDGKRISIAVPYPASATVDQPYFFPLTGGIINHVASQNVRRIGDWLVIETQLSASVVIEPNAPITGLFRYGADQGLLITAQKGVVQSGGALLSSKSGESVHPSFILMVLAALAGGLLLNIMPCVFPILGLKALALAKAGNDERAARTDALAYTAGVVLSCVALGGIILALRAGGQEVGWAFQLQSPEFVLFLLLLMIAVTANLAGLFELGGFDIGHSLSRRPGLTGSFWTGVLAALVATPCTGPFMAAALGAALLLPAVLAMILFAALGLGIALPFLLIAFIPALRNRLPKPGPWLLTFRRCMAVPMGLTAIALLWLLARLTGQHGLLIGALGAGAILVVLVWYNQNAMRIKRFGIVVIVLCLVIFSVALKALPDARDPGSNASISILRAQPFSQSLLASLRAEGKPVFVYFTADWCVTCKINEAAVLERNETARLFNSKGIQVLRGDFTRRDAAIARFLADQGAAGVPLYLYYPMGAQSRQLPQLLSAASLADAIQD